MILSGFGRGTPLFYETYLVPVGIGFFLPSTCTALSELGRHKLLHFGAIAIALTSMLLQARGMIAIEWDWYTLRKLYFMWPVLTISVALVGPVACGGSIVLSSFEIRDSYQNNRPDREDQEDEFRRQWT
jgi:hypothetical protein